MSRAQSRRQLFMETLPQRTKVRYAEALTWRIAEGYKNISVPFFGQVHRDCDFPWVLVVACPSYLCFSPL